MVSNNSLTDLTEYMREMTERLTKPSESEDDE